jgi:hypothetical protein
MRAGRLRADERIAGVDDLTIGDFWSWAYSDVLSNRNRAVFAEFLVGAALGVLDNPRVEWDAYDLLYRGKKIEVKSSAYLQSWQQNKLSRIVYDISRKKSWEAATNEYSLEPIHAADCYVFCLFTERDAAKVNILDVGAWEFFVILTEQIQKELATQNSVGIKRIQAICAPVQCSNLKQCVDAVLRLTT